MRRTIVILIACLLAAGALAVVPRDAHAATAAENSVARSVFNLLNAERKANRLPALTWSPALVNSGRRHNLSMAARNTLAHQVTPEAAVGTRIRAAGVAWHSYAENIAYTTDRTTAGALRLQQQMYGERAPNNGHRLNILSRSLKAVGVDVLIDSRTGKLWLTEDFADEVGKAAAVAPPAHLPTGHLDSLRVVAGHKVVLTGWAVDPDSRTTPLSIAVYYDGRGIRWYPSGVARADVARVMHAGPNQGFRITVILPAGRHQVCIYAINIGPGSHRKFGCGTVTA